MIRTIFNSVGIAIEALSAHKERTFLTTLGITVGVTAVIAMASTMLGISRSLTQTMEAAGPKTFYVQQPFDMITFSSDGEGLSLSNTPPPVTFAEATLIRQLPVVHDVNITAQSSLPVSFGRTSKNSVNVMGSSPTWLSVTGSTLWTGRTFSRLEYNKAVRVAVVNKQAADLLSANPNGQQIRINGELFTVIGGYAEGPSPFSNDEPQIVIPYLSYIKLTSSNAHEGLQLAVIPASTASVVEAQEAVIAALRIHRRLRPAEPNNFSVMTQDQILERFTKTTRTLFLVMILLSSLGLMVGGVGVVAVMTISVTERTREIGIRKALGATHGEILFQFLVESATLTLAGCLSGLALGALVAWGIRWLTPIPTAIPLPAVAAAIGMAIVTGMLFGIYPASRAARLDPVAALRHE